MKDLEAENTRLRSGVEELLRVDPPLHLFARYALEEVAFAGVKLRKGEKIGLLLCAANRNPERFPNPDVFDSGPTPNPHVSFGSGIHFCVGAPLARLELAVALPGPVRPAVRLAPHRAAAPSRRIPFSRA
jgi:cytochrome P450